LGEINMLNIPDSLFFVIRYEQAVCNFLNNDPTQALWNLEEIKYRFTDSVKTLRILPLNILCLNSTRNWDEAVNAWNYLLTHAGLTDSVKNDFEAKVNNLYKKGKTPALYSGKKAENLSRFIPGAGQMYCGAVFEGAFNLIMNASLLGYSFFEFYSKYYFTGYFVGLGIFNKTYNGGMHRAKLLADEKSIEGMNKFNVEVSSLLIRILNSQPPGNSWQKVLYKDQIRNSVSFK
jgi:hypothetical protein